MPEVLVRKHAPTQCEIMFGKRRVGYVCFGERKPINFLNKGTIGVEITDAEKIHIAKETRRQMASLNAEQQRVANELSDLISPNYESEDADEGTDSTSTDEA
ncbi:MAG: hypothetical protein AAGG48_14490 [Planctomycetota bacterium]